MKTRYWTCWDNLKPTARPASREPGPIVRYVRSCTVANLLSIRLVVLKWLHPASVCEQPAEGAPTAPKRTTFVVVAPTPLRLFVRAKQPRLVSDSSAFFRCRDPFNKANELDDYN